MPEDLSDFDAMLNDAASRAGEAVTQRDKAAEDEAMRARANQDLTIEERRCLSNIALLKV